MDYSIQPQVKEIKYFEGICHVNDIKWQFIGDVDSRVIKCAKKVNRSNSGILVEISHKSGIEEKYILTINKEKITIEGESAAGAFYAIKTLKTFVKIFNKDIPCCRIVDYPDMKYRGFYQDVTRGKIPTLNTLKKLVDNMADYKMNSLQLYVEHTFEFKEYEFCREKLGYLTVDEIKELDAYCVENFIDLIPSLSTFGHLYHLLQSEKYNEFCELKDYQPQKHYWIERMFHHTINPLKIESFELIKSLIDQFMPAFTSKYFNICCDETFDLGKGVNKGKDADELYLGFVKKIIDYVEKKGKTVMMWSDVIVVDDPKSFSELSNKLIFLNWSYDKMPLEKRFASLKNYNQIVCPGTSSWHGFLERLDIAESNIQTLALYGKKYGAKGILNTNWGDLGNPASVNMAMYSLILGGCLCWNLDIKVNDAFHKQISMLFYGNEKAVEYLFRISNASHQASWLDLNYEREIKNYSQEGFLDSQKELQKIMAEINNERFENEEFKQEFLIATKGQSLLVYLSAKRFGLNAPINFDFENWLIDFKENWLKDNKKGELDEMIKLLKKYYN